MLYDPPPRYYSALIALSIAMLLQRALSQCTELVHNLCKPHRFLLLLILWLTDLSSFWKWCAPVLTVCLHPVRLHTAHVRILLGSYLYIPSYTVSHIAAKKYVMLKC